MTGCLIQPTGGEANLLLFIRQAVNNFWLSLEEQHVAENLLIWLI